MIHLCYLKRKIPDQEEFYEQFLTSIFPHVKYPTDLIITSEKIKKRPGLLIFHQQEFDLESCKSFQIDNIFLTEFDDMNSKFLRTLVIMKSKKSEIIGISNNYNDKYKKLQLEVQQFRNNGFTDDQIAVTLILKNNLPSHLINSYMNNTKTKIKNMNIKEINKISDIIKFIKIE